MPRTALVTGGGSGIGRGIALALARRDVAVVLVGRRSEVLAATAGEIAAKGGTAQCYAYDLADGGARAATAARVRAEIGPLDFLFHNAATLLPGALSQRDSREIEQAVALNLVAPLDLTARLLPELAACRGTVVFVGSAASFVPMPFLATYSGTKAGLRAISEVLRYELEPQGVRIAFMVPSVSTTAMVEGLAHAGGVGSFPRADPAAVGERLVHALFAGRVEWFDAWSDWLLVEAYRLAPRAVGTLLRWQRGRFERMSRARDVRS